jgi:hypothetical protein
MFAIDEDNSNLFLVVLRTGMENTSLIRSAFMFASLAAAMDLETVVYCVQQGADAMVKGVADKEERKPGVPTIRQRLTEALEMGVRIEVCEQTARVRNIRAEDLIPGVTLVGGAKLIDYAIQARGSLTF